MLKQETHLRTLAKSITWRIVATVTTVIMVFIFTNQLLLALEIGALESISKFILYYGHERIWTFTNWGINVEVEDS